MIKIEKVINKNDLKAFIAFPSSLYPDDPNWIPPLFIERNEHLSAKNPGTDHIIWQAWVAKKSGADSWAYYRANRYLAPRALRQRYRSFRHD
ncbi:FIG010505: hypothetical protein [Escherichia coli ISC7]|uniref:Uncharacterized protein n=1 Tax=Escherichia coli ISC7 TaxID=1432555 RepID=W1EUE0_ECOLX|nr:FIG010505: hypothetical protein [Escherichia coli ISC7]